MKYRPALSCLLLFVSLSFASASYAHPGADHDDANHRPPNIVFILVDDLGAHDLGVEGSTFYQTPNVDALAGRGMRFTRGYAACQVCSPSRASIMTGKYTPNHGITNYIGAPAGEDWRRFNRNDSHLPPDYARNLSLDEVTLAEALRAQGYRTFFAGKWHLGNEGSYPTDHGFDINVAGHHAGGPYGGGYFSPYNMPFIEDGPAGESLTLRLGQETANFIEENADRPFFAMLSFYAVHAPIQTTPALWRQYRDRAEAMGLTNNDTRFIFDRRLPVRQVQDCPIYAGMVDSMDQAVGIVMAQLEAQGLLGNTIICFTSDNGGVSSGDAYATSNLPLRGGKGRQWEGGIREPFYVVAPGLTQPGSVSDVPVHGVDWYPTLLDLAGIDMADDIAAGVDGVSLVPLLRGEAIAERPLFWHYPHYGNQGGEPSSIIMRDEWKLIYYHEDGRNELYNLDNDPGEQSDLAAAETDRTRAMRAELDAWLQETHAQLPTPDPQFNSARRDAHWQRMAGQVMQRLEQQHAEFLSPTFRPNADWWGSSPVHAD